ncbi:integrator complex subunit 8-like [Photinus pyralis]|uniref:INTS8 TPR repeats domain-containing protein n=1 Tax=Photinus pyralis TaxID=7054 RepID=A0A1Y1MIF8_PHOPY|nr:integrator complex subunit 8-like [Photinus pyralis]
MDVDLLRPGTVPISPDTVLWFEFLLREELLLDHLQKEKPDPSPVELINKFTSVVYETTDLKKVEVVDGDKSSVLETKYTLKHLALKILSLKVVAYLKWNLDIIKELPYKFQLNILQDLLYFTNNQIPVDIFNVPDVEDTEILSQPFGFALVLFHRWVIRSTVNCIFMGPVKFIGNIEFTSPDDSIIHSPQNVQKSVCFLTDILAKGCVPHLITYDCFATLKEDSLLVENNWDRSTPISKDEFYAQISYDLAEFYFFKENYETATSYFNNCMQYYNSISHKTGFLNVNSKKLEGYCLACSCSATDTSLSLLQQLHMSTVNQYMGILNILQKDNLYKEISLPCRKNLELDVAGATSSGKFTVARDLLPKIQALNAVRCILDRSCSFHYEINNRSIESFIWAVTHIMQNGSVKDKESIKSHFLQLSLEGEFLNSPKSVKDFVSDILQDDLSKVNGALSTDISIPASKQKPSLDFSANPRLESRHIEQQIISCYNVTEIQQLVTKVSTKSMSRSMWKINPCWELPIPLQSVLVAMPKGFLQDYSFILLAKSKELMLSKNWNMSLVLLKILKSEIQNSSGAFIAKLNRLISWEALLIQINQLLEEWPAPAIDKKLLAEECETCLQPAESVLPRTEIMEHCALCLLNLGHFEFLSLFEKRLSYFEIAATIASASQDLTKFKGNKKLSRDLWDLVLPVFGTVPAQSKRNSTGNTTLMQRDSPINNTKNTKSVLLSFFLRLRDSTVLTVIISMLSKLHNVLRDESSLELNMDYIMLWPAAVSNANSYNPKVVLEVLQVILEKALQYYPFNISWIRLMGDINFVNEHYEEALNNYLKSFIVCSDNFTIPIRYDDLVIRRMIKSCGMLGCYTQVGILCQFLENVDYTLAFHSLGLVEQKLSGDALDAYYHCIWNNSILEYLVHIHNKRGEFRQRKRATQVTGLLELNSNNNEEIRHEASNLRKNIFLRALCKLYVH